MRYCSWVIAAFVACAMSCATSVEQRRITLSDVDQGLAREFQSETEINGLHPAHSTAGERIVWSDFCRDKECYGPARTYTRLSRKVGVTAATVAQIAFVVQRIDYGALRPSEAEAFLELGWTRLPAMERTIGELHRQLEELDPDVDFKNVTLREKAWDAIAVGAEQLRAARQRLEGLGPRVADLYRSVNPAFACEEPEPPQGIVMLVPTKFDEELDRADEFLRASGEIEGEDDLSVALIRRGLAAVERERTAAARSEMLAVTGLEIEGPLERAAARDWIEGRADALRGCVPSERSEPVEVEVMASYSSEALVSDVRIAHTGLAIPVVTCLRQALEGTALGGDVSGEGGRLQFNLAIPAAGEQALAETTERADDGDADDDAEDAGEETGPTTDTSTP